ncbi:MAG: 3-deoxy-7-phosphoheptulonate synthase [Planctomycetota bacterium]
MNSTRNKPYNRSFKNALTSLLKTITKTAKDTGISSEHILKVMQQVTNPEKDYHLVSRDSHSKDSRIRISRDVIIGSGNFIVIAGPCAVESKEQILKTACAVKNASAHILRGGIFKPRTSPYSFQGLGWEGLEYLHQAKLKYNIPIITEVTMSSQVEKLISKVDIIQIGARNMQNFALLSEVGKLNKPVLLKRGMMASIDEFLAAAEYILSKGNRNVILCERGIRTFETATRSTLDLSAVPILKEKTYLPVIVDPSHALGCRRWVAPLVKSALACGADGVMIEIHPSPDTALSDGEQSLNLFGFRKLMKEIYKFKKCLPNQK